MCAKSMERSQDDFPGPTSKILAILLISMLGLFLEMLLIRWIGTEIRIFAFLQNMILVVCFLGLGIGSFTSRQPANLRQSLIPLFVLLLLMALPLTRKGLGAISELLSVLGDVVIWYELRRSPWESLLYVVLGLILTYCVLILIVDIFVPIGRLLGRLLDEHPKTILAYSVNIGGSLLGTWLFVVISFFYQPPVTWFVILAALACAFLGRAGIGQKLTIPLLVGVVALSWFAGREPGSLDVVWSPYQKLVVGQEGDEELGSRFLLMVNNVGYQSMIDLSEAHVASHPEIYSPAMRGLSQYDIPLLLHDNPQSYLIVGAGAGNDAAGALRQGVREVTAVEIDPAIVLLGRSYHPERPYNSPAVRLVNDDARSFFATTDKKFDVIAFGLLDSHTTTSMTNARLDHYVYTRESIARAKSLLATGGIMVLTFESQKRPYITDRMAGVLRDVFDQEPVVFRLPRSAFGAGGVMFVAGDLATAEEQLRQNERLAAFVDTLRREYPLSISYTTKATTDDWPYLYLETPRIPILYYLMTGVLALIFLRSYKRWRAHGLARRWSRSHWHFFFLGAAFLLLEVQNISKASVVLGNTWQVNAVIVSGVLGMALLSNLVTHRFPTLPLGLVYGALIGACLALYLVDLARFALLPYVTKAAIVGCLTTMPMFFSGIVFIRSFAAVSGKHEALGANMLGALVGALLQSITFVVGIKALLLVVAGLYTLSLLTLPGAMKQTRPLRPTEMQSPGPSER